MFLSFQRKKIGLFLATLFCFVIVDGSTQSAQAQNFPDLSQVLTAIKTVCQPCQEALSKLGGLVQNNSAANSTGQANQLKGQAAIALHAANEARKNVKAAAKERLKDEYSPGDGTMVPTKNADALDADDRLGSSTKAVAAAFASAAANMDNGESVINTLANSYSRLCKAGVMQNFTDDPDCKSDCGITVPISNLGAAAGTMKLPKGIKLNKTTGGFGEWPKDSCDPKEVLWKAQMELCIAKQKPHPRANKKGDMNVQKLVKVMNDFRTSVSSGHVSSPCISQLMEHTAISCDAAGSNKAAKAACKAGGDYCKAVGKDGLKYTDESDDNSPCKDGAISPYDAKKLHRKRFASAAHAGALAGTGDLHNRDVASAAYSAQGAFDEAESADQQAWAGALGGANEIIDDDGNQRSIGQLYVPPKALVSGLSLGEVFGDMTPIPRLSQNTH